MYEREDYLVHGSEHQYCVEPRKFSEFIDHPKNRDQFIFGEGSAEDIASIEYLQRKYGNEIHCDVLLQRLIGNRHRCPSCNGRGKVKESSWIAYHEEFHDKTCPLCDGAGWTEKEYKPRMVQNGWEEVK